MNMFFRVTAVCVKCFKVACKMDDPTACLADKLQWNCYANRLYSGAMGKFIHWACTTVNTALWMLHLLLTFWGKNAQSSLNASRVDSLTAAFIAAEENWILDILKLTTCFPIRLTANLYLGFKHPKGELKLSVFPDYCSDMSDVSVLQFSSPCIHSGVRTVI